MSNSTVLCLTPNDASDRLLQSSYQELRRVASAMIANERPGLTLQATALVHEAYLRVRRHMSRILWNNEGHFIAATAESMRRVLIESARRKSARKRGAGMNRIGFAECDASYEISIDRLDIQQAISKLEANEPMVAKLIQMRFYGSMSNREAALALGISLRTAVGYWAYAKAYLLSELSKQ